ncbi:hypothetical protein GLYMA_11G049651v4 [Glycine max]|nr:hypothetical protein GLYMA_11G049651v4 [Glycine max]KAH1157663.1 hypothetical protein GYH30_030067 [Glycine max]
MYLICIFHYHCTHIFPWDACKLFYKHQLTTPHTWPINVYNHCAGSLCRVMLKSCQTPYCTTYLTYSECRHQLIGQDKLVSGKGDAMPPKFFRISSTLQL